MYSLSIGPYSHIGSFSVESAGVGLLEGPHYLSSLLCSSLSLSNCFPQDQTIILAFSSSTKKKFHEVTQTLKKNSNGDLLNKLWQNQSKVFLGSWKSIPGKRDYFSNYQFLIQISKHYCSFCYFKELRVQWRSGGIGFE